MSNTKPLAGIKVIDFSAVFAGPICTRFMLDCGADVIKVEAPGEGDLTRGPDGLTRVFAHFNAGKRSVAIDLKNRSGQMLARQLIRDADVVIENFRPGIMAKFALDYASLKQEHPGLVYCSISGFGQSGPQVNRAAFAPIVHAASGFDSVHANAQNSTEKRPANWEIMMADMLSGAYAFGAIQTALLGKLRSGVGEYIDVSMMEAMMTLIPAHLQAAQMEVPATIGRYCPVKTRDGFVMVCVVSDKNLRSLSVALNRAELLEDPRFVFGPRTANQNLLAIEIEKWSTTMTSIECEQALNDAGVPCSSYQQPQEMFAHPQVVERESFAKVHDTELGEFLIQNMPAKFGSVGTRAATWVARLGQHTDEVLREALHLDHSQIADLRSQGVVA